MINCASGKTRLLVTSLVCFLGLVSYISDAKGIGDDNDDRDWFLCEFDGDACYDYSTCTLDEAYIRAGFTCESFPFYSGGIWEDDWLEEVKVRNCTIDYNSTYCDVWYAVDYKVDTTEEGYCKCEKPNNAGKSCDIWVCYQGDDGSTYIPIDFSPCDGDNKNDLNYTIYCPDNQLSSTLEIIQCWCYVSGGNNEYCLQFYCEERDYFTDNTYTDAYKFSYHLCESYFPLENTIYDGDYSYFNKFCWKWRGNKVSEERFEISECKCDTPSESKNYCVDWYCDEKEMPYYIDAPLFLFGIWFFNIFVFIFNFFPLLFNKYCNECIDLKSRKIVMIWFFCGFFVINTGIILCSGLIGEIFFLVIWYFSWHFVFIYHPYHTCNSYRVVCFRIAICDNLCCLWDKIDNIIHVNMIDGVLANDGAMGGIVQNNNNNNNNNNNGGGGRSPQVGASRKSIQQAFLTSRKEYTLGELFKHNVITRNSISKHMLVQFMSKNSNVSDKEKKLVEKPSVTIMNDLYFVVQQRTAEDFMIDIKFKIKDHGSVFPFEGLGNTEFNVPTLLFLLNEEKQTKYNSNEIDWNIESTVNFLNNEFNTGYTSGNDNNKFNLDGNQNGTGTTGVNTGVQQPVGGGYGGGYGGGDGVAEGGGNQNVELQLYQE